MPIAESLIGERVHIENSQHREKPIRSLAKALSWRCTGSLDTILLSWLFTSNVNTALAIGLSEVITKTILYYFHERAWSRIKIGIDQPIVE
ncbi:MAG: DUF2061 domain-containing protein [Gammaproteobacteria bacterium]|nr:DUF2061 domain-containing protein [Gammaproteobacteria bacterium]